TPIFEVHHKTGIIPRIFTLPVSHPPNDPAQAPVLAVPFPVAAGVAGGHAARRAPAAAAPGSAGPPAAAPGCRAAAKRPGTAGPLSAQSPGCLRLAPHGDWRRSAGGAGRAGFHPASRDRTAGG